MAIRFLDLEVYSIYENEISKGLLLDFFLTQKHTSDIVLIIDADGLFTGIITYKLFLDNISNIKNAIQREFVYFDEKIWEGAKRDTKTHCGG